MSLVLSSRPKRWLAACAAVAVLASSGCSQNADDNPFGTPVTGGSVSTSAATLSDGDATDKLGAKGSDAGVRYYAIDRRDPQEGVWLAVSARPAGAGDGFSVSITTPDGKSCDSGSTGFVFDFNPPSLISAVAGSHAGEEDDCLTATRLIAAVKRTSDKVTTELEVRLRVTRLPKAVPDDFPEPDTPSEAPPEPQVGSAQAGKPGQWLSDAEDIAGGVTVKGDASQNTLSTYKVKLDWGQSLQVKVVFPEMAPSVRSRAEDLKLTSFAGVVTPQGKLVVSEAQTAGGSRDAAFTLGPVAYRSIDDTGAMPGDYTIVVGTSGMPDTSSGQESNPVTVPYSLTTKVSGQADAKYGPGIPSGTGDDGVPLLTWALLGAGVVLIIAGMGQVALRRSRGW